MDNGPGPRKYLSDESGTHWQHQQFPAIYHDKLDVIFDGVDTELWSPGPPSEELRRRLQISDGARVVTYAAPGIESMRGFDIFHAGGPRTLSAMS